LPPDCAANLPARVNKSQFDRPKKFEEIEPKVARCDQAPLQDRQLEGGAVRSDKIPFHPGSEKSGADSETKERQRRHDVIAQTKPTSSPPQDRENYGGLRRNGRLAHQTEKKKSE
jgi:hypothetical protein